MRAWLSLLLGLLVSAPAWCQEIVAVLERSQTMRLASMSLAATESPRAVVVRTSFEQLVQRVATDRDMEVRVVTGPIVAECLLGRTIVANESLAEVPEPVRLFLLAQTVLRWFLNGEKVQDVNLEEQKATVKRHDGSDAAPLKDRPRKGHIGFQELSRNDSHVEIRNGRIQVLD